MRGVSVCQGCRNKMLQAGWPKQHNSISSKFWSLVVQNQCTVWNQVDSHICISPLHLLVPCIFLTHKQRKEKVPFMQTQGLRIRPCALLSLLLTVWGRQQRLPVNVNLGWKGSLMPKTEDLEFHSQKLGIYFVAVGSHSGFLRRR